MFEKPFAVGWTECGMRISECRVAIVLFIPHSTTGISQLIYRTLTITSFDPQGVVKVILYSPVFLLTDMIL